MVSEGRLCCWTPRLVCGVPLLLRGGPVEWRGVVGVWCPVFGLGPPLRIVPAPLRIVLFPLLLCVLLCCGGVCGEWEGDVCYEWRGVCWPFFPPSFLCVRCHSVVGLGCVFVAGLCHCGIAVLVCVRGRNGGV